MQRSLNFRAALRRRIGCILLAVLAASTLTATLADKKRPWPLGDGLHTVIHYKVETNNPCHTTNPSPCSSCAGLTSGEKVTVLQLKDAGSAFTIDKWHDYGQSSLIDPWPDDGFGRVLAVDDFDADGFDDLAAGVPNKKVNGVKTDGYVLLFRGIGAPNFIEKWRLYSQPMSYPPDVPGDLFGGSLATGDFNRRHREQGIDLVMGTPGKFVGAGAFYVARGRKGTSPDLSGDKNPATIATPPLTGEWYPGFWTFYHQESQDPR